MSVDGRCERCGRACDGCSLCCHEHPGHRLRWEPFGCRKCIQRGDDMFEEGRALASQRDDLIAAGVDPADLLVPVHPDDARDQT